MIATRLISRKEKEKFILAIVVDEIWSTSGIVYLERYLSEEIVCDIKCMSLM